MEDRDDLPAGDFPTDLAVAPSGPPAVTSGIQDDGTVTESEGIQVPSHWGFDQAAFEGVRRARALHNLRHGLLANVPMICKAAKCPFVESCFIPAQDRKIGMRCPIEVAAILERFERYCDALVVRPETDIVDAQLVKDLVDLEIQMSRAEQKLAQNGGEFIDMVVAAVDQQGNPHLRPELSKAVEYKRELRKEHHRILQLLNSTRKDREAALRGSSIDAATAAAELMARARGMQAAGQIRTVIEVLQPAPIENSEVTPDGQGERDSETGDQTASENRR